MCQITALMLQNVNIKYVRLRIRGYRHQILAGTIVVAHALAGTNSDCGGLHIISEHFQIYITMNMSSKTNPSEHLGP